MNGLQSPNSAMRADSKRLARPITSEPIYKRPKDSQSLPRLIIFNVLFAVGVILLHSVQLCLSPLLFVSGASLATYAWWCVHHGVREAFGLTCVAITQIFGPTTFVLTAEKGVDLSHMLKRDKDGHVVKLDLPQRSVVMSNHQIYADWLYIWCLLYLARLHGSVIIILKASLKWVPVVGPAMQFFQFIFLNRSWAADKEGLASHLSALGADAAEHRPEFNNPRKPMTLLIFPEGTLISRITRPVSRKFAEKQGVADVKHTLLPRSTGILFCLRSLRQRIPDLALVDMTIGYAGIPADGYGQDHYTLQSIYGYGHSPPTVHIHLRVLEADTIPMGKINQIPVDLSPSPVKLASDTDPSSEETQVFDTWLREKWAQKDALLETFYQNGHFDHEVGQVVAFKVGFISQKDFGRWLGWLGGGVVSLRIGWFILATVWKLVRLVV